MPPISHTYVELTVEIDAVDYNCQVIDAEHIPPGRAVSITVTETACPGGKVEEDTGAASAGSLKGNVFGDSADAGITMALREAYESQTEFTYRIVHFPELGPTGAIEETGRAKVASFSYGTFAKPGTWRHPIDLALLDTAGATRPAAVA